MTGTPDMRSPAPADLEPCANLHKVAFPSAGFRDDTERREHAQAEFLNSLEAHSGNVIPGPASWFQESPWYPSLIWRLIRRAEQAGRVRPELPQVPMTMMADGAPKALQMHPAAALFPRMHGPRFEELKEDIRQRGLIHKIVLCEGKVLDGRNRLSACEDLGITPEFEEEFSGNPYDYVWSVNGQRRDLNAEQRYIIFKRVMEHSEEWEALQSGIREGANRKRSEAAKARPRTDDGRLASSPATSSGDTGRDYKQEQKQKSSTVKSKASGTNRGAVERMDRLDSSRPDLADKVVSGELKPTEALRQMRKEEISKKVKALPEGKFRVLYADPPWKYNDERELPGMNSTAAAHHYPTMTMAELQALDVRTLSAEDAVLFCWATFPLFDDQLEVIKAWGFKYKTAFVWDKGRANFGHYHKAEYELLIVATRGSCVPDADERPSQAIKAVRTKHSAKPEVARELIDKLYPQGPRLELFFRGEKPPSGWKVWGAEAEDGKGCGEAASASIP